MNRHIEHDEQAAFVQWCLLNAHRVPELALIFSIPNGAMLGGGRIGAIRANYLKAEGLKSGVCDLFLPYPRGGFHGMFIEMKASKGKLSPAQKQFIKDVEKLEYFTTVCYSADEAIEQTEYYIHLIRSDYEHS